MRHRYWYISCSSFGCSKTDSPPYDSNFLGDIEQVYRVWFPTGHYEAVFVAIGNKKPLFDAYFSRMVWLAFPHEDLLARDILAAMFPSNLTNNAALFDPLGSLVVRRVSALFRNYGPEGFPFTKQAVERIKMANGIMWKEVGLNKSSAWGRVPLTLLLGVQYVLSPQGNWASHFHRHSTSYSTHPTLIFVLVL